MMSLERFIIIAETNWPVELRPISSKQAIAHHLRRQKGYIVNLAKQTMEKKSDEILFF